MDRAKGIEIYLLNENEVDNVLNDAMFVAGTVTWTAFKSEGNLLKPSYIFLINNDTHKINFKFKLCKNSI